MTITSKRNSVGHPSLLLNNSIISEVQQHCHLGLTIKADLNWDNHIINVTNKANKRLGILKLLKFNWIESH